MRLIFSMLIVFGIAGIVIYFSAPEKYSCFVPIRYSIGELDERFGISEEELRQILEEAEGVWEEAAGRELFVYNEKGRFKVNLVYDERQLKTDMVELSEDVLNQKEAEYKRADDEYKAQAEKYNMLVSGYNLQAREFNNLSTEYSNNVRAWNRSDRTDSDRFNALQEEERELRQVEEELRDSEEEIKEAQEELRRVTRVRNRLAEDYNINVADFNQRFGGRESFDQGIYSRGEITIYQFNDKNDLALVLAHEFGHALGIGHVDDSEAVMYYLMENQPKNPIKLSPADKTALDIRCPF